MLGVVVANVRQWHVSGCISKRYLYYHAYSSVYAHSRHAVRVGVRCRHIHCPGNGVLRGFEYFLTRFSLFLTYLLFLSFFFPSFFPSSTVPYFSSFIYLSLLLPVFRHNFPIFFFRFLLPVHLLPSSPSHSMPDLSPTSPSPQSIPHTLWHWRTLVTESVNRFQPTRPFLTGTSFKKQLFTLTIFDTPTRLWAGDSRFFPEGVRDFSLFPNGPGRLAVGPTQYLTRRVAWDFTPGKSTGAWNWPITSV